MVRVPCPIDRLLMPGFRSNHAKVADCFVVSGLCLSECWGLPIFGGRRQWGFLAASNGVRRTRNAAGELHGRALQCLYGSVLSQESRPSAVLPDMRSDCAGESGSMALGLPAKAARLPAREAALREQMHQAARELRRELFFRDLRGWLF